MKMGLQRIMPFKGAACVFQVTLCAK